MDCKILIVEDDARLREVLCDYFRSKGDDPTAAADGMEALRLLGEADFDGLSVCRAVRRTNDVPIIFLTALSAEEDKLLGYELGADDYVTKPFTMSVLYAKTVALIRRSRRSVLAGDRIEAGGITLAEGVFAAALPDAEPEHRPEPRAAAGEVLGLRLRGRGAGGGHPHQAPARKARRKRRLHQDRHQGGL